MPFQKVNDDMTMIKTVRRLLGGEGNVVDNIDNLLVISRFERSSCKS